MEEKVPGHFQSKSITLGPEKERLHLKLTIKGQLGAV